jgi:hypothetical protein
MPLRDHRCPERFSSLRLKHQKSPGRSRICRRRICWQETQRPAYEASRIRLTVVKRTDREVKGFIVLSKGWIFERTFGWVRARSLAKDFETLVTSSQARFMLSLAFLLVCRIAMDYKTAA